MAVMVAINPLAARMVDVYGRCMKNGSSGRR
jgi:hypothetical protein